jgi:hypothetical protein
MIKRNRVVPVDKNRAVIYDERDYEATGTSYLSHTVYLSEEPAAVDTGLLDASGNKIMRDAEKRTIGFIKF